VPATEEPVLWGRPRAGAIASCACATCPQFFYKLADNLGCFALQEQQLRSLASNAGVPDADSAPYKELLKNDKVSGWGNQPT
jgi:hypothetical protein